MNALFKINQQVYFTTNELSGDARYSSLGQRGYGKILNLREKENQIEYEILYFLNIPNNQYPTVWINEKYLSANPDVPKF